eukprot:5274245-Ditylum_brightwellii.AAC.1
MANGHRRFWTKLIYIKGENNVAADAMIRLETKEFHWLEEGTSDLHTIAKGLTDRKKQTNRQLSKKVPA